MNTQHPNTIAASGFVLCAGGRAYSPEGLAAVNPSPDEVTAHNAELARQQIEDMRKDGSGMLYLFLEGQDANVCKVGTWDGSIKFAAYITRVSWHNMAGAKGRTDIDFNFDGSRWHGVNIGDNDIVRCKRCKR